MKICLLRWMVEPKECILGTATSMALTSVAIQTQSSTVLIRLIAMGQYMSIWTYHILLPALLSVSQPTPTHGFNHGESDKSSFNWIIVIGAVLHAMDHVIVRVNSARSQCLSCDSTVINSVSTPSGSYFNCTCQNGFLTKKFNPCTVPPCLSCTLSCGSD